MDNVNGEMENDLACNELIYRYYEDLDHDGYLPTYAYIDNAKRHDVTIARKVPLSAGSIIAMDRAYNDYKLYA
jgi:hypothetical protein